MRRRIVTDLGLKYVCKDTDDGGKCEVSSGDSGDSGGSGDSGEQPPPPPPSGCVSYFQSMSCPGYVQVNNGFTISYSFWFGTDCTDADVELYQGGSKLGSHGYTKTAGAPGYEEMGSFNPTAPSTSGTYTYTLKLTADGESDSRSCTINC